VVAHVQWDAQRGERGSQGVGEHLRK
jgi:hypothetical protein